MVHGPRARDSALVDALSDDDRLATSHRHASVRAHLLELAGELRRRAGRVRGGGAADD
ncbi:MAG: hypothetical protein KatS3mg010_1574 [Acidimicrobiia bacterium]|nr:MAG: hypothetical protein KatS3mg010_1574 [Acidimicrobiia bacterium]